jgi:hypothetical protein
MYIHGFLIITDVFQKDLWVPLCHHLLETRCHQGSGIQINWGQAWWLDWSHFYLLAGCQV